MKISYFLLALALVGLGGCTYTMKIQNGDMAYERKQYAVAVDMLRKEFNKAKTRVEKGRLAYFIGRSYDALHNGPEAIEWYKIAYDNQYGVDALRDYAYALKQAERYDEAQQAFKDLGIEIGSPYEYRKEILASQIAQAWLEEERREYRVQSADFNSAADDYSPTLYKNDQLVITSDRAASTGDDTYNWTGKEFSDLFLVDLNSNQINPFDPAFNTEDNEGTVSFNGAYSEVYFTRCSGPKKEDAFCKLMVSRVNGDGSWSTPEALNFVTPGVNYMHPSLSADGQRLYFSSNHADGWGGYDIYVSNRAPDGLWGPPQLLSRSVNTTGDEQFPFIDNDTLYFASTGHTGMGGLDIFRTYVYRDNWAPPHNLKPPINSGGDDFGLVIDRRASLPEGVLQQGYFSSRRTDGAGLDDVYRFEKIVPPPLPPAPEKPVVYRNLLDVYVLEKIYEDPTNPNSRVLGRRPLPPARLSIIVGGETKEVKLDEEGRYTIELADNQQYDFTAGLENYLSSQAAFDSRGLGRDPDNPEQRYEVEIVLDKIFLDKEIRLENIYYDFDQWFIRDDAKPTLDELTELLRLNPDIRIQLGSHTDCRGSDRYNEDLSQKRAESAVDYLISQGISADRLQARGYGESQPQVNCLCTRCTEDEHQENRRTTFKIVE